MLQESSRVLKSGGIYVCISLHPAATVVSRMEATGVIWAQTDVVVDTVGGVADANFSAGDPASSRPRREKGKEDSSEDTEYESDEGDGAPAAGFTMLRCAK